jgi:AraC-like DNA-binding protein
LQLTGQTDQRGNLLTSNSETSGRSLEEMAAAACLSAYYFARQFKRATGLPPNQYILARRVESAQQLLQRNRDRFLAEVAARAGFADQSQLTRHFKRLVGVTPGQFGMPARIAKKGQASPRNGGATPLPFLMSRVSRRGRPEGECGWISTRAF